MTSSSSPSSSLPSFQDKVVVVTGGGSGIGKALCDAFCQAGAVVVALDLKFSPQAERHEYWTLPCNVTHPSEVASTLSQIKQRHGKIDIYCSNAGILLPSNMANDSCVKHSLKDWNKILQVNLLAHVTALRLLLPDWERGLGDGHFLVTASAAGLLTMVGDASYGVSKAAALSFCEHVAISHAPTVKVHCLCPQAVDTPLVPNFTNNTNSNSKSSNAAMTDGVMTPEQVAEMTLRGIHEGEFFIFPHTNVPKYALRKAKDHARWLQGMQRMRNKLFANAQEKKKKQDTTTTILPRSKL